MLSTGIGYVERDNRLYLEGLRTLSVLGHQRVEEGVEAFIVPALRSQDTTWVW